MIEEVAQGIYEIDEYDCASVFVIAGQKEALVIDTGTGIGNIKCVIEKITGSLPYHVILSHIHVDHMGGAYHFQHIGMNKREYEQKEFEKNASAEERRSYADFIRSREGKDYPYNLSEDIREWDRKPNIELLTSFPKKMDLGGREVTCYECPGHTKGSLVFLDHYSRTLLVGDTCNGYYILDGTIGESRQDSAKKAYEALKQIDEKKDQFDRIINGHHDYREFGKPLEYQYLLDTMNGLKDIMTGKAELTEEKSFLSKSGIVYNYIYGKVKISITE